MGPSVRWVIALCEGGLWTQLRRCAEGFAEHPYCRRCGPFKKWANGVEAVGEEAEENRGEGGGEIIGAGAGEEDIDWGEDMVGEANAGCRVGTVAHRAVECP